MTAANLATLTVANLAARFDAARGHFLSGDYSRFYDGCLMIGALMDDMVWVRYAKRGTRARRAEIATMTKLRAQIEAAQAMVCLTSHCVRLYDGQRDRPRPALPAAA